LVDSLFALNGYGNNGTWHGYVFAATFGALATITPMCDPTGTSVCFLTAGAQLCAHGNIAVDPGSTSGAVLGWNLNQPSGSAIRGTVPALGAGVTVQVARMTAGLRVQIEDVNNIIYCAPLPAGGAGVIPWTSFNTTCWTPATGTNFTAGAALQDIAIVVPSSVSAPVSFDFCLVDVR